MRKRAYEQRPQVKARRRARRQLPEAKERKRAYQQRPEVQEWQRQYQQQRWCNNPKYREQAHCHRVIYAQIRAGKLIPGPCARCGATENVEAHHHDYSKPLEVTWYCHTCHRRHHTRLIRTRWPGQSPRVVLPEDGEGEAKNR